MEADSLRDEIVEQDRRIQELEEKKMEFVGIYPPVRISKDMLYVILLSCGSHRMDSGVFGLDRRHIYHIHESINLCFRSINCSLNCVHRT
jgi:hypothetical protein